MTAAVDRLLEIENGLVNLRLGQLIIPLKRRYTLLQEKEEIMTTNYCDKIEFLTPRKAKKILQAKYRNKA